MNEPKRSLGEYLRYLRKLKKPKQGLKQVAPLLGVDYTYLSNVELDHRTPTARMIFSVADTYGLSDEEMELLWQKSSHFINLQKFKALFNNKKVFNFFRIKQPATYQTKTPHPHQGGQ